MKQFQKYGVAAAVASVATGAVATTVSTDEVGDLAIIPYYTVLNGQNTGMHVINTTGSTQVIKVRLRRGADSADALDFNVVMSPYDEWTASVVAGGANGVKVVTGDSTCTVPKSLSETGEAEMGPVFADGATEGYIEIIGMAQTTNEAQPIAIAAKHQADDGMPLDCAAVESNFLRVSGTDAAAANVAAAGTHLHDLTSNGTCPAAGTTACAGATGTLGNGLSQYVGTDDNAFKVSYFITDSDGGLEAGDNALMIEGFAGETAADAMMTNQERFEFNPNGSVKYDPMNFELPNLAYGQYDSSVGTRNETALQDGTLWNDLRAALDTDYIANDWASFETSDAMVATDWVVTLPGQYVMNNAIYNFFTAYTAAGLGATACTTANVNTHIAAHGTATVIDNDELPLELATSTTGAATSTSSTLQLWDREEVNLNEGGTTDTGGIDFSPGGSGSDEVESGLNREVNVLTFGAADSMGVLGSALGQDEDPLGLRIGVVTDDLDGDRGWARLQIIADDSKTQRRYDPPAATADDGPITCADTGTFVAMTQDETMVTGFAVWERSFSDQAGNYGRMIEHSSVGSGS